MGEETKTERHSFTHCWLGNDFGIPHKLKTKSTWMSKASNSFSLDLCCPSTMLDSLFWISHLHEMRASSTCAQKQNPRPCGGHLCRMQQCPEVQSSFGSWFLQRASGYERRRLPSGAFFLLHQLIPPSTT
ncbi:hypothetical protein I3842_03G029000 [Carya illinoinensis]|uniref:Uncharacterized protein n=1 Tax=Carya illinoinensis TaxID=32201 RepID=A0A922FGU0_CARIL|nr:hypothetical protein I3842_03G029000 [Carya illinoinensis]